jgi:hypothetical protein
MNETILHFNMLFYNLLYACEKFIVIEELYFPF